MTWGWDHNFPTAKDTFTKPIDYPTVGWDWQIADWYQDIFDAVEDVQEYLLAGIGIDRGDPVVWDFTKADFIYDMGWHDLDLSPIVGAQERLVLIRYEIVDIFAFTPFQMRTKGNINVGNTMYFINQVANIPFPGSDWVYTNADGKVSYLAPMDEPTTLNLTVGGWV